MEDQFKLDALRIAKTADSSTLTLLLVHVIDHLWTGAGSEARGCRFAPLNRASEQTTGSCNTLCYLDVERQKGVR